MKKSELEIIKENLEKRKEIIEGEILFLASKRSGDGTLERFRKGEPLEEDSIRITIRSGNKILDTIVKSKTALEKGIRVGSRIIAEIIEIKEGEKFILNEEISVATRNLYFIRRYEKLEENDVLIKLKEIFSKF